MSAEFLLRNDWAVGCQRPVRLWRLLRGWCLEPWWYPLSAGLVLPKLDLVAVPSRIFLRGRSAYASSGVPGWHVLRHSRSFGANPVCWWLFLQHCRSFRAHWPMHRRPGVSGWRLGRRNLPARHAVPERRLVSRDAVCCRLVVFGHRAVALLSWDVCAGRSQCVHAVSTRLV